MTTVYQTLSIWLGTQFTHPNLKSGPLQGVFGTLINPLNNKSKTCNGKSLDIEIMFWDTSQYFHSKHLKC